MEIVAGLFLLGLIWKSAARTSRRDAAASGAAGGGSMSLRGATAGRAVLGAAGVAGDARNPLALALVYRRWLSTWWPLARESWWVDDDEDDARARSRLSAAALLHRQNFPFSEYNRRLEGAAKVHVDGKPATSDVLSWGGVDVENCALVDRFLQSVSEFLVDTYAETEGQRNWNLENGGVTKAFLLSVSETRPDLFLYAFDNVANGWKAQSEGWEKFLQVLNKSAEAGGAAWLDKIFPGLGGAMKASVHESAKEYGLEEWFL